MQKARSEIRQLSRILGMRIQIVSIAIEGSHLLRIISQKCVLHLPYSSIGTYAYWLRCPTRDGKFNAYRRVGGPPAPQLQSYPLCNASDMPRVPPAMR